MPYDSFEPMTSEGEFACHSDEKCKKSFENWYDYAKHVKDKHPHDKLRYGWAIRALEDQKRIDRGEDVWPVEESRWQERNKRKNLIVPLLTAIIKTMWRTALFFISSVRKSIDEEKASVAETSVPPLVVPLPPSVQKEAMSPRKRVIKSPPKPNPHVVHKRTPVEPVQKESGQDIAKEFEEVETEESEEQFKPLSVPADIPSIPNNPVLESNRLKSIRSSRKEKE